MKSDTLTKSFIILSHRKNMSSGRAIMLSISIIAVLGLFIPLDSSAIHDSEGITWQLVMISSSPACSGYHYQMMNKYNEITEEYLELYQTPNIGYKPTCMTEYDYDSEYSAPDELDLLILVYDRNKGRADLHSYEIGGIYSHIGKEWTHNHTIIICDCSNFNYSDPPWILSHELSHFILYYLGYDLTVVEEQIHELDVKYDYCIEVKQDITCNEVKSNVQGLSQNYVLMKPYEPAVGQSFFGFERVGSILDVTFKKDMMSQATIWWLEGKITDNDYLKSLEILSGQSDFVKRLAGGFASADRVNVFLTEPPKDSNQDAIEQETAKFSVFDGVKWTTVTSKDLAEQKKLDFQKMIAYTDEQERILTTEEPDKSLPQWFKTRALWWVNEQIENRDFISGMEYLYKP